MSKELKAGLRGLLEISVTELNTAVACGSGLVPVFATPAMIGLMEGAAVAAISECLEAGQSSVGIKIEVSHLAATPVGMKVRAEAELLEVSGRRLIYSVKAYDEKELIGEGRHERFLIMADQFLSKAQSKLA